MTTKTRWRKVAAVERLQEGVPFGARLGARAVVLVSSGGRVRAVGGECTHYGAPLAKGRLQGHVLTCPWHTARFDIQTGQAMSPPALDDLARYETKVEAGNVYVRAIPADEPSLPRGEDGRTFLILGAGAGGLNAALSLRRIGFAGRVLMATAEPDLPYDRPALSKGFMAGETPREDLLLEPGPAYRRLGIEILKDSRATGVDKRKKTVAFVDGRRLRYDKLLLATGGTPRFPGIQGADLPGVFVLRSLRDALAITASLSRAKTAAILGGSFLGLEVAASLRSRGLEVHVIAPETVLMARVFGPRIGAFLKRAHEKQGVVFHLGRTAAKITGEKRAGGLVLSDGTRLSAGVVIAAIGAAPVTGYLRKSGLLVNDAVPVDATFQTRDPDIFAVGDIALAPDPLTGEARRVEHWVEAGRQGRHAARGMTGVEEPYRETPFFWTNQHDVSIKYAGYASSIDRIIYRGDLEAQSVLAGYYREGALRAVASLGRTRDFLAALEILKAGGAISPSQFKNPRFDLAEAL